MVDDPDIVQRIDRLIQDEHAIQHAHEGDTVSDDDRRRLAAIEVSLDQCWDLLRQRRARRSVGQDPDAAAARPESVVEGYQQ